MKEKIGTIDRALLKKYIFKNYLIGFAILFFLADSAPAQSQTSIFPDMVQIEADCFTMRSKESIVEKPRHKVCLNACIWEFTESLGKIRWK